MMQKMKFRIGFVSNSSSSSFILNRPAWINNFEKFKYFIAGYTDENEAKELMEAHNIEVLDCIDISPKNLEILYNDIRAAVPRSVDINDICDYVDIENVILHIAECSYGTFLQYDITDEIVSKVLHKDRECDEWLDISTIIKYSIPDIMSDYFFDMIQGIFGDSNISYNIADKLVVKYMKNKVKEK
jgi:hypothetical protein